MFYPLSLYIGLRYTRAKRRTHFISFISLVSVCGIGLGITVLITVLAVMNGFDYEIRQQIFHLARQITVVAHDTTATQNNSIPKLLANQQGWQQLQRQLQHYSGVQSSAPFVFGQGLLVHDGLTHGVVLNGIIPQLEQQVSALATMMVDGSLFALQAGEFGIILATELLADLQLNLGDKVLLMTPSGNMTPLGFLPRFKQFKVVGSFHAGQGGVGLESSLAFIHLEDAQKLLLLGSSITGINVKLQDLYQAPAITAQLIAQLPADYQVTNWTQHYGSLFKAIKMEKTTIFIILLFIIAVAMFNLVSGLMMMVNDKRAEIAILRTLGATPAIIMGIFIVQGAVISLIGIGLGVVGGVLLATNAPILVHWLEQLLQTNLISASIYFIDYLPSRLNWQDVWLVALITFTMGLLVTIYPAWRATKLQAIELLRYE